MKAHFGVDADSGLVHTLVCAAENVNDVTRASALVRGEETDVFADARYQGVTKREEAQGVKANWHVAMRPGKLRVLDKAAAIGRVLDQLEHLKVRYRWLAKNTAQMQTLLALSNFLMAHHRLLQSARG